MNKHLLVVGPGYLGKAIVREAKEGGWLVSSLSRSGEGGYRGDVTDQSTLQKLAQEIQPTHIVHCASASAGGGDRLESYKQVYLEGCRNLTAQFPNSKILFTSSTSVYGQEDGSEVDVLSDTEPSTATGRVLLDAENVILTAGAGGIVARLSGIYGNGRSYILKRLLAGEAQLDGDGARLLNHIHHVDGARACLFLLEKGGESEVFNVTDTITLSQKETYQKLCKTLGLAMPKSAEKKHSARGNSDKSVSNKKLLNLGWQPLYPCFADAAASIRI